MTKTSLDITTEALQHIRVTAVGEAPAADHHSRAKSVLEGLYAELSDTYGIAPEWTIETVPDELFIPMSRWLAGVIAPAYNRPEYAGYETRGRAGVLAGSYTDAALDQYPAQAEYY